MNAAGRLAQGTAGARERSDRYTGALIAATQGFEPEAEASNGGLWRDTATLDLRPGMVERRRAALAQFVGDHEHLDDRDNRIDLAIVLRFARRLDRLYAVQDALVVPYRLLANTVFSGFSHVLSERVSPQRRMRAREKLLRYTGRAGTDEPLTVAMQARLREALARPGLLMPPRGMIEKDLAMTPLLLDDIADRFSRFGIPDAGADLTLLRAQFDAYGRFLREAVLPRAREDFALPAELHELLMQSYGVETAPADLAAMAHDDFVRVRDEMERMAQSGALGPPCDYRTALRRLAAQKIPADGELMAFYAARNGEIETILRDHDLIELPRTPLPMEAMSEAESLSMPAPNMDPGPILDPEPVPARVRIPTPVAGQAMDDFSSDAAAWPLMAHEARPGHELQFRRAAELELSLARTLYADGANAEGWGLYAEAIVEPYEPTAGQFMTLAMRLHRVARAFLDPELHLGRISVAQARAVLKNDLCVSDALAESELFRYTQLIPGQATSYYYGFKAFTAFRAEMERKVGEQFTARRFHEAIVAAGCIPFDLMRPVVLDAFGASSDSPAVAD